MTLMCTIKNMVDCLMNYNMTKHVYHQPLNSMRNSPLLYYIQRVRDKFVQSATYSRAPFLVRCFEKRGRR